ncbi:MAG: nucleotide sugar dehydrogenase, partial [Candidatus Woesearchaeota archaeon]|nr:nucleotide sugar dehydrogenase [Candidatus Woesearchaeota archaeon]
GVTEDICVPIIEKASGLKCGKDWKIGYSPERINPGDKEHTIEKVIKVVSGMDRESLDKIAEVYSSIVKAGVYKAQNIKTAEAAKVIENIQRDLNIALMNELSLIFSRIGLNTKEVLDAAGTKWNFHKYYPGLVGGHCIGVDPYYLTYLAQKIGYDPKVILAGREINDSMAGHVADLVIEGLKEAGKAVKGSKVLLMGLTFKENVPDIRNSKAKDIVKILKEKGAEVIGYDPLLEKGTVKDSFGIENLDFDSIKEVDAIVLVNSNKEFEKIGIKQIRSKMKMPVLIDVKNFYKDKVDDSIIYKSL